MQLHLFGASAGTQPFPGFHHTSFAIETNGLLYVFDAGECCGYTAHIMGVDLLKTRAVFLSHPHMDHVGGLGNLLWYVRKISGAQKREIASKDGIDVFSPCQETVDGVFTLLSRTEGNFETSYPHHVHVFQAGKLYEDDNIAVEAIATTHMPQVDGKDVSFGFRILCEGKTVVYTGDCKMEDYPNFLPTACDLFLTETGHHKVPIVCEEMNKMEQPVGTLFFMHHGAAAMRDLDAAQREADETFRGKAVIGREAATYTF